MSDFIVNMLVLKGVAGRRRFSSCVLIDVESESHLATDDEAHLTWVVGLLANRISG